MTRCLPPSFNVFLNNMHLPYRIHQAKKSRVTRVHQANCLTPRPLQPVSVFIVITLNYAADPINTNDFIDLNPKFKF